MPGATPTRVFIAALAGCNVFDPNGDQVGKVRDAVVSLRSGSSRLLGLVVEVPGRRRIFLPMTRRRGRAATQSRLGDHQAGDLSAGQALRPSRTDVDRRLRRGGGALGRT
jgi:hypothetical protein